MRADLRGAAGRVEARVARRPIAEAARDRARAWAWAAFLEAAAALVTRGDTLRGGDAEPTALRSTDKGLEVLLDGDTNMLARAALAAFFALYAAALLAFFSATVIGTRTVLPLAAIFLLYADALLAFFCAAVIGVRTSEPLPILLFLLM